MLQNLLQPMEKSKETEEEKHEREYQEWLALSEEEKEELLYLDTLSYWEKKEYLKQKTANDSHNE